MRQDRSPIVLDGEDRLRVSEGSLSDSPFDLLETKGLDAVDLASIGILRFLQIPSQEESDPLVGEAGCGVEREEVLPAASAVPRLLEKLSLCTDAWLFSWFEFAGGDLPQRLSQGTPVLRDEQDRSIVENRQDGARSRMKDDLAADTRTVGELARVDDDAEQATLEANVPRPALSACLFRRRCSPPRAPWRSVRWTWLCRSLSSSWTSPRRRPRAGRRPSP
jgi:hypothetical protein